mgnify:CR=1 FL=1
MIVFFFIRMSWWRNSCMILFLFFLDLMLIIVRVLGLSWFQVHFWLFWIINDFHLFLNNFRSRWVFSWCWVNLCIISKWVLMFTINKLSEKIFMVLLLLWDQWRFHLKRNVILLVFGRWFKTCWVYWINLAKCRFTEHVMIVLFFLSVFRWRHSYMISSFCRFYLILVEFRVLWFFWSKFDIWCGLMINVSYSFLNFLSGCWIFFLINLYIIPKRVFMFIFNKVS